MSIANPVDPKTWNCTLSASGWGRIRCKALTAGHGISVVSSGSQTRTGRAIYITKQTSSSFGVVFICTSYEEYERFGLWMLGYGKKAAVAAGAVGPMRVSIPGRKFDKVAIPSGFTFGDVTGFPTYVVPVNFGGARDPVPYSADYVSSFSLPKGTEADSALPYFYPAGKQLSGQAQGDDALYDDPSLTTQQPSPERGYERLPSGKMVPF